MELRGANTGRAIEEIARLRAAEHRADDSEVREALGSARRFLEGLVGPTVSRAQAARILGISQTALSKWLTTGELSSVVTPEGRREMPVGELVRLLARLDAARASGARRPLSVVLRDRRRTAEAIDLERLVEPLPAARPLSELQGLALHRLVAERIDDELVADARARLRRWQETGRMDARSAEEWERLLGLPFDELADEIGADTPRAHALRQSSPFAGALTEPERRRLLQTLSSRR